MKQSSNEFEFISILGRRYRLSYGEAIRMLYFHWSWLITLFISYTALVIAMPQNYIHDFTWPVRLTIWAVVIPVYHLLFLGVFYLGSLWGRFTGRAYFTPIGLFFACFVITYGFYAFLPNLMEIEQPSRTYLFVETCFNTAFVCLFEALYYAVSLPIAEEQKNKRGHDWERM